MHRSITPHDSSSLRSESHTGHGRRFLAAEFALEHLAFPIQKIPISDSPASAYFPTDMHRSIIGAELLNGSVRDGKRCGQLA